MRPIWLLQSSGITVSEADYWFAVNTRFLDYGLIPSTDTISNIDTIYSTWKEYGGKFITRGGTKLLTSFSNECLKFNNIDDQEFISELFSSIWWDKEKFDQKYYSTLDLPLVNGVAEYRTLGDVWNISWDKDMFIKPSSDGKAFSGGIIRVGVSVKDFIENTMRKQNIENETILIAPLKQSQEEYRFFCMGDTVITGSQYMKDGEVSPLAIPDNHVVHSYATDYARLYQPDKIFVMDIGRFNNKWEIVEYNCANCSGVYKCNLDKLVSEWEMFVNK